ncbi:hypothetical protein ABTQ05_21355, partial [Acinetobacter baumannii]
MVRPGIVVGEGAVGLHEPGGHVGSPAICSGLLPLTVRECLRILSRLRRSSDGSVVRTTPCLRSQEQFARP